MVRWWPTVFFSAVANFDGEVMASFNTCSNAVKVSRVMSDGGNHVIVADHLVGWHFVSLWVSCPSKGICLAVRYALDEFDPVVKFLEFNCPPGLLRSISAYHLEVFEVPVIHAYFDQVVHAS
jgi:hypothetical protein